MRIEFLAEAPFQSSGPDAGRGLMFLHVQFPAVQARGCLGFFLFNADRNSCSTRKKPYSFSLIRLGGCGRLKREGKIASWPL